MDKREAIARALMEAPTRNGKFSDFIHEDEALNAADAILTRTEATAGEVERLREAWRDGFAECKARLSEDVAFEVTEDVEEDAWLDSKTCAALAQPVQESKA